MPLTNLYEGSRSYILCEEVLKSYKQEHSRRFNEKAPPFHEWVKDQVLDGRPFTWDRHEYLLEPYKDFHPYQVEMKAAQLGLTSKAILRCFYSARYLGYRGILYLFPSRSDVSEFSKARIGPLVDDNPNTIGEWVQDTDSINLKKIWQCFLYLRGMRSTLGLKSVPADFLVTDELDEAPPRQIDKAFQRMGHSEFKHFLGLSNPTLPDYGIDKLWQQTDQRFWMLKCPKCGEFTCLEDTFPACLEEHKGDVLRICQSCRDAVLDPSIGAWVAKRPGIEDKRGYHYSQLFSHFTDLKELLHDFKTTTNLSDFYNLRIGFPYVEAENRLSIEEVLALCGSEPIRNYCSDPCFMGIDQGKDLHVVIGRKDANKGGELVHLQVYKDFEELDRLMKMFSISRCVVDALPETRKAREFAGRHPGRVFLCYYSERKEGPYQWNEKTQEVKVNRTESLDASHSQITKGSIVFPRECDVVRTFAEHCHATARKLEEEEDENGQKTGKKRYMWVKLGEDHFRHSFNYETMARQSAPNWMFPELQ
jgi:hypothetical protein